MKNKICFFVIMLFWLGFVEASQSNAGQERKGSYVWKPFQIYAGLSGGVGRLTGRRNESVFNAAGQPPISTFASNVRFTSSKAAYSLFTGITGNIPNVPVFLGPEIYLGRNDAESNYRSYVLDPFSLSNRTMQTSIRQSTFFGIAAQAGVHLPYQTRIFGLIGGESSQFQYSTYYIPRSAIVLGGAVDLLPPTFSTTKWIKGFMWGFGVEKDWNHFRFGGDIRIISYSRIRVVYITPSGDGTNDNITNSFKPQNIRAQLRLSYLF